MTRAEIRTKYGISVIEDPRISNEELKAEDAELYEKIVVYLAKRGKEASERQLEK